MPILVTVIRQLTDTDEEKMMRQILRKPRVAELTGLSGRQIDRLESAGEFVERVRLGAKAVGWYSDEVEEWIDTRQRGGCKGATEAAIKTNRARSSAA